MAKNKLAMCLALLGTIAGVIIAIMAASDYYRALPLPEKIERFEYLIRAGDLTSAKGQISVFRGHNREIAEARIAWMTISDNALAGRAVNQSITKEAFQRLTQIGDQPLQVVSQSTALWQAFGMGTIFFLIVASSVAVSGYIGVRLLCWGWFFGLQRVCELSRAVNGKTPEQ